MAVPRPSTKLQSLYTPIKEWQTRLICLQPGEVDVKISCSLHVVDLIFLEGVALHAEGFRTDYDALSYSWGTAPSSETIQCNEISTPVSQHLAAALRCMRDEQQPRYVWIDALCINQNDNVERSLQVRMMFTIFKKAKKVVAWLGDVDNEDAKLLKTLPQYSSGKTREISIPQAVLQALRRIYGRSWFTRSWIRQEVFAARELEMRCGQYNIPWWALSIAVTGSNSPNYGSFGSAEDVIKRDPFVLPFQHLTRSRSNPWEPWNHCRPRDLSDLTVGDIYCILDSQLRFRATEAQDKVYALIGVLETPPMHMRDDKASGKRDLVVDYTKRVVEVFEDMTRHLLSMKTNLALLCFHTPKGLRYPHSETPSWVLDWDRPCEKTLLGMLVYLSGRLSFSTGRALLAWDDNDMHLNAGPKFDGKVLNIQAMVIGTVTSSPIALEKSSFYGTRIRNTNGRLQKLALDFWKCAEVRLEGQLEGVVEDQGIIEHSGVRLCHEGNTMSAYLTSGKAAFVDTVRPGDVVIKPATSFAPFLVRQLQEGQKEIYSFIGPVIPLDEPSILESSFKFWRYHEYRTYCIV